MTLTRSGEEIAAYFALADDAMDAAPIRPRYNIAPSQQVPTIVQRPRAKGAPSSPPERALEWKIWGLVPSWSKAPIAAGKLFNARSETAAVKPSFRSAWKRRRCLVVCDGFYEWTPRNRGHRPYHFRPAGDTLLALAGLFEEWVEQGTSGEPATGEVIESCTILTTEANADLAEIHHRMPVILAPEHFDVWLDPHPDSSRLEALMVPAAAGTLRRLEVTSYVNRPQNDDPECLRPATAAQGTLFEAGRGVSE